MKSQRPLANVFGLGRVGLVTSFLLCEQGFSVKAIDIDEKHIQSLKAGEDPFCEPGFSNYLQKYNEQIEFGLSANKEAEFHFICVPSPEGAVGYDMSSVHDVLSKMSNCSGTIVVRTTLKPGTSRGLQLDFHRSIIYMPEFYREGSFISDWQRHPSLCCGGDKSLKEDFQRHFASKYHLDWMSLEEAEVLKVSSNMFHALKVVFANEVGRLSQSIGASSKVVMENFCKDQHLNISEKYLKPGFAFGGPCLGKDVHVMEKALNLDNFLPEAILQSNETHLKWVAQRIEAVMKPPIFILGASFKSEAKDYRDSAVLELVRQLRDRGLQMIASEKIFSSQGVDVYEFSEALSKAKSVLLASHSLSSTERDALAEFRGIIFDLLMTQQNEVIRNHSGYSPLLD